MADFDGFWEGLKSAIFRKMGSKLARCSMGEKQRFWRKSMKHAFFGKKSIFGLFWGFLVFLDFFGFFDGDEDFVDRMDFWMSNFDKVTDERRRRAWKNQSSKRTSRSLRK